MYNIGQTAFLRCVWAEPFLVTFTWVLPEWFFIFAGQYLPVRENVLHDKVGTFPRQNGTRSMCCRCQDNINIYGFIHKKDMFLDGLGTFYVVVTTFASSSLQHRRPIWLHKEDCSLQKYGSLFIWHGISQNIRNIYPTIPALTQLCLFITSLSRAWTLNKGNICGFRQSNTLQNICLHHFGFANILWTGLGKKLETWKMNLFTGTSNAK